MKTQAVKPIAVGLLAAALAAGIAFAQAPATAQPKAKAPAAAAAPAATPAAPPAATPIPAPRLAAGIKAQEGYESVTEKLVLASATEVFTDIMFTSPTTGQPLTAIGSAVTPIAKVKGWNWYLLGKDGVGVGYISRGALAPADAKRTG